MKIFSFHFLTKVRGITNGGVGPESNEVFGETLKEAHENDGMKTTSSSTVK